ncbi:helix-turn-helix domain-containing protein [Actinocorallia lasiicapitis]
MRARRLARMLRDQREAIGMHQSAVAAHFGWSTAKVGHIESARNKVSARDVALLLEVYGVTSPEREQVLALAREADQRNWWTDFRGVLTGPYVALEDAASSICEWAPLVIPGLLQTVDYARAAMTAGALGTQIPDLEQRLRARMARQTVLTRAQDPPRLHVVIDGAALTRTVAGPEVMRGQLRHLLNEAARPNITIQVIPVDGETHPGLDGQFIVMRFPDDLHPDVGYVEGFMGGTYLESPQAVGRCTVAFELLAKAALPPDDSVVLLEETVSK